MIIIKIVGLIIAVFVLWTAYDIIKGVFIKDAPRKPETSGDTNDYDYTDIQMAVWLIEHPDKEFVNKTYEQDKTGDKSLFAWRETETPFTHDKLTEENLLKYIKPLSDYMAKRYDCSDFRAIWLCKLRYALLNSSEYGSLLTPKVEAAIEEALTNFKYWITSPGADSMCYYSENHQMVFAVSEYLAGISYPDSVFAIDGKKGCAHAGIAKERMNNWFDQRGKYGFSEFLSSNYLGVDIGALSMLITYCEDAILFKKAELALNILLLDYALQMYDYTFIGPAGRDYARNNTSFYACTSSHVIVDKIWDTGETGVDEWFKGFPYLFISLVDSGKYSVPEAIVAIGRDNSKGVVKSSSGQNLKEMEKNKLIGLSDYQLMFQLGMGALSNEEVIDNTLNFLDRFDVIHNNFVSSFKFFNIKPLRYLKLTKRIVAILNPFSNGMALQRNNVYSYICPEYKLSTNQMYFPGSYGAQQMVQMACLPCRINVFTTNSMKGKEFMGYGVAPCAAQNKNVMMSIYNIPKKNILLATGDTRHYTSTYFPKEKFDDVILDRHFAFGRIKDTYIALVGTSDFKYDTYSDENDFEKKIFDTYELYQGFVGPYVDSFRLTDYEKGFDLRQEGDCQFTIYELGCAKLESFDAFMKRIKNNLLEFTGNELTYKTLSEDLKEEVTYVLDYAGKFSVNGVSVNAEHDRYESAYVHAGRDDSFFKVTYGDDSYTFDLSEMENVL